MMNSGRRLPHLRLIIHAQAGGYSAGCDGASQRLSVRELPAILRRRLPDDFLEHTVEMRERLKADFVSDFADAQVGIE